MGTQANTPLSRRRSNARRVLLAALVVGCLILFTAYSTEGESGPLHGLQGAAGALIAPIQSGTTRAVQPLRDAWGWSTSLIDARDRAAKLEAENARLRQLYAQQQFDRAELGRLDGLQGVGDRWTRDYQQVPASIIGASAPQWSNRIKIDRGRNDGVVVNSPVMGRGDVDQGLVGLVTQSYDNSAIVTLISNPNTTIGVVIEGADSARGLLTPGAPPQFQVTGVPADKPVSSGQPVFTAGFSRIPIESPYPPGIPVGIVVGAGSGDVDVEQRVQVRTFVNARDLSYVVVLTPQSAQAKQRAATP